MTLSLSEIIVNNISQIPNAHHTALFEYILRWNIECTKNKNGVFVNLTNISEDILEELLRFTRDILDMDQNVTVGNELCNHTSSNYNTQETSKAHHCDDWNTIKESFSIENKQAFEHFYLKHKNEIEKLFKKKPHISNIKRFNKIITSKHDETIFSDLQEEQHSTAEYSTT
jgi:hypothetical protein